MRSGTLLLFISVLIILILSATGISAQTRHADIMLNESVGVTVTMESPESINPSLEAVNVGMYLSYNKVEKILSSEKGSRKYAAFPYKDREDGRDYYLYQELDASSGRIKNYLKAKKRWSSTEQYTDDKIKGLSNYIEDRTYKHDDQELIIVMGNEADQPMVLSKNNGMVSAIMPILLTSYLFSFSLMFMM